MNRSFSHLLIIVVFVFCSIIFTYPSIKHISTHIIGDGGDNLEFYSYMYMVRDNLDQGKSPFAHTQLYRFPAGFNLNLGSDGHLFTYVGALLIKYFNGYLVYNGLVLLFLTVNGIASYTLFHYLSKNAVVSVLCSIVYAYSYTVLSRAAGYTNVLGVAGFPLIAVSILRIVQSRVLTWSNTILFFLSLALLSLTSLQHLITTLATLLVVGVVTLLFYPNQSIDLLRFLRPNWIKLTIIAQIFLLAIFTAYSPYFITAISSKKSFLNVYAKHRDYRVPLVAYVVPSPFVKTYLSEITNKYTAQLGIDMDSLNDIDRVLFYGYVELFLFLVCLVSFRKKLSIYLFVCFSLLFIFSFPLQKNGVLTPLYYIQNTFPFSSIQEPERLFSTQSLLFTIIVALGLTALRLKRKHLVLIIVLLMVERLPQSFYQSSVTKQPFHEVVKNTSAQAVLDIPVLGNFQSLVGNHPHYVPTQYYMEAIYYNKPIIDGYINWPAEFLGANIYIQNPFISQFVCDRTKQTPNDISNSPSLNQELYTFMRDYNVSTVVIHKNLFYLDLCYNTRVRSVALNTALSFKESQLSLEDYNRAQSLQHNDLKFNRIYEDNNAIVYTLSADIPTFGYLSP